MNRSSCHLAHVAAVLSLSIGGCAGSPTFRDAPVVWKVDDSGDIAEPKENEYLKLQYFGDVIFMRRLDRLMEVHTSQEARDTNALDDVPDSTWFENRISRRSVSPEEVKHGPGAGPPVPPLVVVGSKVGGGGEGFIVTDSRKVRYLIKFDNKSYPEMETATDAIVSRLFWTVGYNVPGDHVFILDRSKLTIDPKTTFKDALQKKHPFDEKELEKSFASAPPPLPDGTWRAFASEYLHGVPKGGAPLEGVRNDDPNDLIPHEHRRVLRGLRVFAAWLGHTDLKLDNLLDMYVTEQNHHFLRHYLLDFGGCFGSHAAKHARDEDGFEYVFDWDEQGKALVAFGLWKRPWEGRIHTRWTAVGAFAAEDFDPEGWKPAYPFFPFFETTPADMYWGAKIAMKITREHVVAAVESARLSDPTAAAYIVETVLKRRDMAGRAWLDAVTPLDDFRVKANAICMTDLVVQHHLAANGIVEKLDEGGTVTERVAVGANGEVCVAIGPEDRYQVLRLRMRRGDKARPVMQVHVRGGSNARVLGVIRAE